MSGETLEELEALAERKRAELSECDCSGCTMQSVVADLAVLRAYVAELREAQRCSRAGGGTLVMAPNMSRPMDLQGSEAGRRLIRALAQSETGADGVSDFCFKAHERVELEAAALEFWRFTRANRATREGAE